MAQEWGPESPTTGIATRTLLIALRCGFTFSFWQGRHWTLVSTTVPNGKLTQPAEKIRAFISDHRDADLVFCTGNTSVRGLAWLSGQVDSSQRVTIVIGDMLGQNFSKASEGDRGAAASFLRRPNVKVHNWYRKKPEKKIAHGKAVVALREGKAIAGLVGSANLTHTGLYTNLEMMVRSDPSELPEIEAYISEATRHPPATEKLIGLVAPTEKEPVEAVASKGGCLPALVLIPSHVARNLWNGTRLAVWLGR